MPSVCLAISLVAPEDRPTLTSCQTLFKAYEAGLGISLAFQGFDEEVATLPGKYALQHGGALFLATHNQQPVGCVAYYQHTPTQCELKRLFVLPDHRGQSVAKQLMQHALAHAKTAGYATAVLDSLKRLTGACTLYEAMGFAPCAPYNANPHPDVVYYSKAL